jgi:hypothetical protein
MRCIRPETLLQAVSNKPAIPLLDNSICRYGNFRLSDVEQIERADCEAFLSLHDPTAQTNPTRCWLDTHFHFVIHLISPWSWIQPKGLPAR